MYFPTNAVREYFKKNHEFSLTEEELDKLVDIFYVFFAVTIGEGANIVSTPESQEKRKSTCLNCPSFNHQNLSCDICGCYIPDKVTKPQERCPIDKWTMDLKLVRELLSNTVSYINNSMKESGDHIITIEEHEQAMAGE